jgi:hypothetical protein
VDHLLANKISNSFVTFVSRGFFLLIVGVVIAGQRLLRTQENFCLDCWSISHRLLRERRVEVPKKVVNSLETIDSVARSRGSLLATLSICARKIRVIRGYEFRGFVLNSPVERMVLPPGVL